MQPAALFTTSEAAAFLGVSSDSVRLYARRGRLRFVETAGGLRLFEREVLAEFLAQERVGRRALRRIIGPGRAG